MLGLEDVWSGQWKELICLKMFLMWYLISSGIQYYYYKILAAPTGGSSLIVL